MARSRISWLRRLRLGWARHTCTPLMPPWVRHAFWGTAHEGVSWECPACGERWTRAAATLDLEAPPVRRRRT